MNIVRVSKLTKEVHTRDIPVTQEQLNIWIKSNANIQDVLPFLSADDREFLLNGITPEEWSELIGDEDE